jgi:hypothetical protein
LPAAKIAAASLDPGWLVKAKYSGGMLIEFMKFLPYENY